MARRVLMRVEGIHVRIELGPFDCDFQVLQEQPWQQQLIRDMSLLFKCYTCGTHCCSQKQREIAIFTSLGDNANI